MLGAYQKDDEIKGFGASFELFAVEGKSWQKGTLSGGEQQMLALGRALMVIETYNDG